MTDDSPTATPRPPLSHQISSVPNTPQNSAPPSPKQPFFGYRDERAHLTVRTNETLVHSVGLADAAALRMPALSTLNCLSPPSPTSLPVPQGAVC